MHLGSIRAVALCLLLTACGGAQKSDHTERNAANSHAAPATQSPPASSNASAEPSASATSSPSAAPSAPQSVPPPKGSKMVTSTTGLKYEELAIGTGASPIKGHRVQVHYTGWLADGSKFDSSRDRGKPYDFVLGVGSVIRGWDEAILTMKVGGRRKLTVPPHLAYGSAGRPPVIPPNATLTFEVELVGAQ